MEDPSHNSRLRPFVISFACWSALCVLMGMQLLIADHAHDNFLPLFHYIIWPALVCYPWALLTPAVLDFARHYPFTQANWLSQIGRYLIATVVFLSAEAVLQGTGSWALHRPQRRRNSHQKIFKRGRSTNSSLKPSFSRTSSSTSTSASSSTCSLPI